jgi:ApaG protein
MSTALTNGILVSVEAQYIPERSSVSGHQFAFAYTVNILNQGPATARLETRHWIITDAVGKVEEVRGPGVVGVQPRLRPGESFEYTSWCVLETSSGEMRGSYQMVTDGGERFDATIAPFRLGLPRTLN